MKLGPRVALCLPLALAFSDRSPVLRGEHFEARAGSHGASSPVRGASPGDTVV